MSEFKPWRFTAEQIEKQGTQAIIETIEPNPVIQAHRVGVIVPLPVIMVDDGLLRAFCADIMAQFAQVLYSSCIDLRNNIDADMAEQAREHNPDPGAMS
jgi:hypothetical protein